MRILAATGHRPDKLGGYSPQARGRLTDFVTLQVAADPPDRAISGMAQGFDTAFALACLSLGIPLIAAVPFRAQPVPWPFPARNLYESILSRCFSVMILNENPLTDGHARLAMHLRNKWMVDNSNDIVALWNGSPGGTKSCIEYAEASDRVYGNLWPKWVTWRRQ